MAKKWKEKRQQKGEAMKKWNREVGTITKQALNRDITAFFREGLSISMWNKQKDAEMPVRGFKQRNNGIGVQK